MIVASGLLLVAAFLAGLLLGRRLGRGAPEVSPTDLSCIRDAELSDLVESVSSDLAGPWTSDHGGRVWTRHGTLVAHTMVTEDGPVVARLLVLSPIVLKEMLQDRRRQKQLVGLLAPRLPPGRSVG